jgi:hypothetical protein
MPAGARAWAIIKASLRQHETDEYWPEPYPGIVEGVPLGIKVGAAADAVLGTAPPFCTCMLGVVWWVSRITTRCTQARGCGMCLRG